jgi:hypothetical protein
MKRYFAIIIALVAVLTAKAGDVNQVGSIWYDIDISTKTASVVANPTGGKYVGEVNIPATINFDGTVRVIAIGAKAFQNSTLLTKVTMTSQITSIGEYAFNGCSALEEVSGYTNVTSIGQYAFSGCSKLTEFHIYSALTTVGKSAFNNCTGIQIVYGHDMDKFGGISFLNNNDGTINSSNPLFNGARLYVYDNLKRLWYQPMMLRASYSGTNRTIRSNTFIKNKYHTVLVVSGITEIGLAAFRGSEMEELILPSSVTNLESYCFAGCTKLKRVSCAATKPPSVASGRPSFYGVDLSKVKLYVPSSSVSAYKEHSYWKNFGSIEAIPETVDLKQFGSVRYDLNSTGSATVVNFDATTLPPNVHIPDFIAYNGFEYRVTSIADFALQNCELSTLDLPTDISYIGSYAFQGCQNLVEVFMDKAIKNIGSNPFKGCTSLQKVRITAETPPSSLNDWENISNATLEVPPSSVPAYSSTAPWSSFSSTIALTGEHFWYKGIRYFLNYDGTASVTGFNEEEMDEDVVILSHLPLETPYTVTSIADRAFQSGYFDREQWDWVYTSAGKIKSIVIPGTVKTIGEEAFYCCTTLKSVVLGNGIEKIERDAFNSTGLIALEIPGSVKSIGYYAFSNNTGLKTVNIPGSVKKIGDFAFYSCTSLTNVTLNEGVELIGTWAFFYSAITSVSIPRSVKEIGINPFLGCYNLVSIQVESGNPYYDSRGNCNAIIETAKNKLITGCKYTVIPEDVSIIGEASFNNVAEDLVIPNQVTIIGKEAFANSNNLTTLTIGKNVSFIGAKNFVVTSYSVFKVKDVYCYAKIPPSLGSDVFEYSSNYTSYAPRVTLHVPASSIGLYKTADVWKDFKEILPLPDEGISTGLEAIDNGELTIDSSLPLYNLHGQLVSHPVKGQIYIQNGRKVKF